MKYEGQKLNNFQKKGKKKTFGAKKTSWGWASEEKKVFFGPKIGKNLRIRSRNWPILKEKKGHFGPRKQAGAELKKKQLFPRE